MYILILRKIEISLKKKFNLKLVPPVAHLHHEKLFLTIEKHVYLELLCLRSKIETLF